MNSYGIHSSKQNNTGWLKKEIKAFLDFCDFDRRLSLNTHKAYSMDLDQFAAYVANQPSLKRLEDITRGEVRSFLRSFGEFKPRTINRKTATLKAFFGYLEGEERLETNPTYKLNFRIKVPQRLPRNLSQLEIQILFRGLYARLNQIGDRQSYAYLKQLRELVVMETLYNTGMRVSEVSNLLLDDVHLEEGYFHVIGKGNKDRIIPICGDDFIRRLKEYINVEHDSDWEDNPDSYFFQNRDRNRLSEQSIRFLVRKNCNSSALRKVTPHVFRHTIATQLLEEGTDIRIIQKFLGHSSITTTTIYAAVSNQTQKSIILANHPRQKLKFAG